MNIFTIYAVCVRLCVYYIILNKKKIRSIFSIFIGNAPAIFCAVKSVWLLLLLLFLSFFQLSESSSSFVDSVHDKNIQIPAQFCAELALSIFQSDFHSITFHSLFAFFHIHNFVFIASRLSAETMISNHLDYRISPGFHT